MKTYHLLVLSILTLSIYSCEENDYANPIPTTCLLKSTEGQNSRSSIENLYTLPFITSNRGLTTLIIYSDNEYNYDNKGKLISIFRRDSISRCTLDSLECINASQEYTNFLSYDNEGFLTKYESHSSSDSAEYSYTYENNLLTEILRTELPPFTDDNISLLRTVISYNIDGFPSESSVFSSFSSLENENLVSKQLYEFQNGNLIEIINLSINSNEISSTIDIQYNELEIPDLTLTFPTSNNQVALAFNKNRISRTKETTRSLRKVVDTSIAYEINNLGLILRVINIDQLLVEGSSHSDVVINSYECE